MRTHRILLNGMLWAAALALAAPGASLLAAPKPRVRYQAVAASDVKLYPRDYQGKYLEIKDYFGRLVGAKSKSDRRLWRRDWVKEQKMTQKDYVAFFTEEVGEGSNMLCYVHVSNKQAVELLQGELEGGARILIKGQLKVSELGDRRDDPDITHFIVDYIQLDHEEVEQKQKLYVSVEKNEEEIPKPGPYNLFCPKCEKAVFTITLHSLTASFDLKAKCRDPKCGYEAVFKFYNK